MRKHRLYAGIAQLVEHDLAKVGVASSNLVSRSKFSHIKKIQNNVVVSMRPLSGAATECRSLLRNEFKSVSRSKFSHIKKIQNNVVVSMRPLSGAATECRSLLRNEFKSVSRSKFSHIEY